MIEVLVVIVVVVVFGKFLVSKADSFILSVLEMKSVDKLKSFINDDEPNQDQNQDQNQS